MKYKVQRIEEQEIRLYEDINSREDTHKVVDEVFDIIDKPNKNKEVLVEKLKFYHDKALVTIISIDKKYVGDEKQ